MPRLAGPAPFKVHAADRGRDPDRVGLAGPARRRPGCPSGPPPSRGTAGWIADHSETGPTTWYHVEPSALRGPATIATRLFADRLPSRAPEVSAEARTARPSTRTVPKPPTAIAAGVAATCEATFQALQLPFGRREPDAERVGVTVDRRTRPPPPPSSGEPGATAPPSTETWTSYEAIGDMSGPDQATVNPGFAGRRQRADPGRGGVGR